MKNDTILRLLGSNLSKRESGSWCYYYPLTKALGIKLYSTASERDEAFNAQQRWSKLGLAPKATRKIDIPNELYEYKRYGYITQNAPVDEDRAIDYNYCKNNQSLFIDMCNKDYKTSVIWPPSDSVLDLFSRMKKAGMRMNDTTCRNIGFLKGKAVFIDLDCYYAKPS